jgi:rubrerythrin
MGSVLQIYKSSLQKNELKEYHNELQKELRIEQGCDTYAGHIGIMPDGINFVDITPFSNSDEAEEYIGDNHDKWMQAMAVPYVGMARVPDKQSERNAKALKKAEDDLDKLEASIIRKIKSTKSKTIGCKKCGSSVSRKWLRNASCPVCSAVDIFYSKTQVKQLKAKEENVRSLQGRKVNRIRKNTTCYVVGGWCSY